MNNAPTQCRGYVATGAIRPCEWCSRFDPDAIGQIITPTITTERLHYTQGGGATCAVDLCSDFRPTPWADGAELDAVDDALLVDSQRRTRAAWLIGLAAAVGAVLLAVSAHAATVTCGPWEPASDPYTGRAEDAVDRLAEIPPAERATLRDMVQRRYGWERVMVTRDSIDGGRIGGMRAMNHGAGRICAGGVDRRHWPAGRHESALAYKVGRWVVLVMDSCRNVALADNYEALPAAAAPTRENSRPGAQRQGAGGTAARVMAVPEPGGIWLALLAIGGAVAMRRGQP